MEIFESHEQFELEVLTRLQSARLLEQLIFGGGSMLRLCHELKRFSTDLDFYLQDLEKSTVLYEKLTQLMAEHYLVKDSQDKFRTILIEIASPEYPRRLKIEINKERVITDTRLSIAWSPFSTHQIPVNSIPLSQMMTLKIEALLDRKEIRDAYDIEFLLRRGISLTTSAEILVRLLKVISAFKTQDFKVKLGSVLPEDERAYYRENRFNFLVGHLNNQLARPGQ
ncbi:MAG: nucleotidyl transferase AbiEii/AbiGii toxin family protein [Candidatus Marinimicrobia bacterium]|nr:nucleotidyl transferase AbiEii/AbiGii toxin family protein [Candidatus Neomarinimicrobiota bacterium]